MNSRNSTENAKPRQNTVGDFTSWFSASWPLMGSAVMITPRIGQGRGRNQFHGVSQSLSNRPNSVMATMIMNMGATPMAQTRAMVDRALAMVIDILHRALGALQ